MFCLIEAHAAVSDHFFSHNIEKKQKIKIKRIENKIKKNEKKLKFYEIKVANIKAQISKERTKMNNNLPQ